MQSCLSALLLPFSVVRMVTPPIPSFTLGDPQACSHFVANGWVLVDTLSPAQVSHVSNWIHELSRWPDAGGDWLHYREMTDTGPKLCRTESFVPFHAGLRELSTSGPLLEAASTLLGQQGMLYKEKVNYKLAGGARFVAAPFDPQCFSRRCQPVKVNSRVL